MRKARSPVRIPDVWGDLRSQTAPPFFWMKSANCLWNYSQSCSECSRTASLNGLGSSHTVKVDVRVVAATNRNLEEEVRKGRFREDLLYRLNIFPITMPPLRDRMEDIPLLVDFYVKKISNRMGKSIELISAAYMSSLQNYHWPGNVRELENVIERAVINSSGPKLRLVDELKKPFTGLSTNKKTLDAVERDYIVQTLEQTHWKIGGKNSTAEILGLDRSTLRARMRKLGIQKP